jgi:hypothetical protein
MDVLNYGKKTIEKYKPNLIIEIHYWACRPKDVKEILDSLDYKYIDYLPERLKGKGYDPIIYAYHSNSHNYPVVD